MSECVICEQETPEAEIEELGMCKQCTDALNVKEGPDELTELDSPTKPSKSIELEAALASYHKRQEYMKEYNKRPEILTKRQEYMKRRQEKTKGLIKRAKELGLL